MRLVDARTGHAHRHRIQPKDAETEVRTLLVAHTRKRLAAHLRQDEWFATWMQQLIAQVDVLATTARQNPPGSPEVIRARQLVEQLARTVPGDEAADIDWHYLTVVYRLGPEDSINEILEHPCRYSHASGNSSIELTKARREASRLESSAKEHERQAAIVESHNQVLANQLDGAIHLLTNALSKGNDPMSEATQAAIHDFFKSLHPAEAG